MTFIHQVEYSLKAWTSGVCDEECLKLKVNHFSSDAFGDVTQRVGTSTKRVRRATKLVPSINNLKTSHWSGIFEAVNTFLAAGGKKRKRSQSASSRSSGVDDLGIDDDEPDHVFASDEEI